MPSSNLANILVSHTKHSISAIRVPSIRMDLGQYSREEVTLDLVGNDFSAVVNDFGIPDGRECIPDGRE